MPLSLRGRRKLIIKSVVYAMMCLFKLTRIFITV